MNTEIKTAISITDEQAKYDESAKRILGNKIILAHILVKTIDEFSGMKPEDAVDYIEGEPIISRVPLDSGSTNAKRVEHGQRIVGLNSESLEINEGLIRFDIIFYVRMRDGVSQIIVNLEAQNKEPVGYYILNRAIFYASRLISSQKERDFVNMNYNDIRRVYSIWVCMGMSESSMSLIHLKKEDILGSRQWKGDLNLLNIVMIGVSDELPEHNDEYELHRLLSTVLSSSLPINEKLGIVEAEYNIRLNDEMRKDVSAMCNLSQGILEKGIEKGIERGIEEIILNMYNNNFTIEQIALAAGRSETEIENILKDDISTMDTF